MLFVSFEIGALDKGLICGCLTFFVSHFGV